nr:transposase [Streptomyces sp. FIT100]
MADHDRCPWRDVPERYGPWDRVYDPFRRWQRDGTWARIVTQLQAEADAKGLITWEVNVDSTVCRTHQQAAGAVKRGTCRRNHPAASASSRPTTLPDAPGAG